MIQVYYYADLDLSVEVKDGTTGKIIASLTPNERLVLQQQFYLALTTFLATRALYMLDKIQKGGD